MAKSKNITVEETILNVNAGFKARFHVQNKLSPRYFLFSVILPAFKSLICKANFCI